MNASCPPCAHQPRDPAGMMTTGCSPDFSILLEQLQHVHARELAALQHQLHSLHHQVQEAVFTKCTSHDRAVNIVATDMPEMQAKEHHPEVPKEKLRGASGHMSDGSAKTSTRSTVASGKKLVSEISRGISTTGVASDAVEKRSSLVGKLSMAHFRTRTLSDTSNFQQQFRIRAARMLIHPWFERFFLALLVLDFLLIAIDMQTEGLLVGTDIHFYDSPGHDRTWTEATVRPALLICSVLFFVEVAVKIIAGSVTSDWVNLVDFVLVILEIFKTFILRSNTMVLSLLRLCRLLRFRRIYRTLLGLPGIDALYLMTTILSGCTGILLWSAVLLVSVQLAMAISINLFLFATYFKTGEPPENQREVFEYFGTFTRAMFSMFEITLANWPAACRILAEHVSEWFMLAFMIYRLSIGFAVVAVINGVFMKETFKVADTDDFIMMKQSEKSAKLHAIKMKMLFDETDLNGDGKIDIEEFREVVGNPAISAWLASQGICCNDVERLFQVLDSQNSEDGTLSFDELLYGIARLKGTATTLDVLSLMRDYDKALQDLQRQQVAQMVGDHRAHATRRSRVIESVRAHEYYGHAGVGQPVWKSESAATADSSDEGLPDEPDGIWQCAGALQSGALMRTPQAFG